MSECPLEYSKRRLRSTGIVNADHDVEMRPFVNQVGACILKDVYIYADGTLRIVDLGESVDYHPDPILFKQQLAVYEK